MIQVYKGKLTCQRKSALYITITKCELSVVSSLDFTLHYHSNNVISSIPICVARCERALIELLKRYLSILGGAWKPVLERAIVALAAIEFLLRGFATIFTLIRCYAIVASTLAAFVLAASPHTRVTLALSRDARSHTRADDRAVAAARHDQRAWRDRAPTRKPRLLHASRARRRFLLKRDAIVLLLTVWFVTIASLWPRARNIRARLFHIQRLILDARLRMLPWGLVASTQ